MEKISLGFILNAVGGILSNACFNMKLNAVSTDTRKITPGCLYIALKGDKFDGNDFLHSAFEKGAFAAVAERPLDGSDRPVIVVKDTREALLKLAAAYRRLFHIPVIGVTGSVGKTSTKEMIYTVLQSTRKTHKNEGNLNNEIGMPISVFGLSREHEAAVFEMGMSGFGEIQRLARVADPDIGVITNIGISHIEKLGSRENILKAKLELMDQMRPGGVLILNRDDELLCGVIPKKGISIKTFGINRTDSDAYADQIEVKDQSVRFNIHYKGETLKAKLPVCGRHNIYNALAAFLCGTTIGMTPEQAADSLKLYEPTGFRQKIERLGDIVFVEDCYNASPDSMNAAFDVLKTQRVAGKRIAVLADMLELGAKAAEAHTEVGKAAARNGVDLLLAFGENARHYCEGFQSSAGENGKCVHFDKKDDLAAAILDKMEDGDAILFKGSRGMKLEETIEKVCEGWKTR